MSVEEEAELKNLVAQTLENKGILPRIRAELRANVFKTLEENSETKETLLKNEELSAFLKFPFGALILNLIREFLEFFELEFTLSVFDPETKCGKDYDCLTKEKLLKELKITDYKKKNPLLCEVVERFICKNESRISTSRILDCSGDSVQSPLHEFNATYIKGIPEMQTSSTPVVKEELKEDDESIKEDLVSGNVSESDSLGELKSSLNLTPKNAEIFPLNENSPESNLVSPVPKNSIEIDLLTFTPVKETKTKEKLKSTNPVYNNISIVEKSLEKKENSMSILKDLPPLSFHTEEKKNHMNEIKAIIDKWPDSENEEEKSLSMKSNKIKKNNNSNNNNNNSNSNNSGDDEKLLCPVLKSDRSEPSQTSGKTDSVDDFEEDISDLLNHQINSDNQLTIDETVSKSSDVADHLESL